MRRVLPGVAFSAIALAVLVSPAQGAGFALQDFDAKALGMANAFAATADNPSAVFYNPAGMSQLDGMQGSLGLTYIQGWTKFEASNPAEGEANTEADPIFFPNAFGTIEITETIHFGFGTFIPYGLSIDWGREWTGRYVITRAALETIEANPNLSVKVPMGGAHALAFAAGFGVVRTKVELERNIDFSFAGANDGRVKLFGDTDDLLNWTWNAALLVSLFDRAVRFGASYRASIEDIDVHGTGEFYSPINSGTGQPILPYGPTRVFTQLSLPDEFRAGLAVQPMDALTIEFDFKWTNWSRLSKTVLEFDDIGRQETIEWGLNDSWFFALGFDFKAVPELLSLRAGGYFDETPVRRETRNPSLPDENRLGFGLGIGLTPTSSISIDASYLTVFFNEATKENLVGVDKVNGGSPRANGEYDTFAHVAIITFGLKF